MLPENLSFIVDTQLPPVLATFLRQKGFKAIHTSSYRKYGHLMADKEIIEIAISENYIIVTKDSDFLDNFYANGSPPRILQLQLGNIKNNQLIEIFELNLATMVRLFNETNDLIIFQKDSLIAY
ncbi:MAG: DUF5615 family PIN-like protein [Emticicia sp.]|nr:DUF5615 family PIN-like protein [Emticicia sp.]